MLLVSEFLFLNAIQKCLRKTLQLISGVNDEQKSLEILDIRHPSGTLSNFRTRKPVQEQVINLFGPKILDFLVIS